MPKKKYIAGGPMREEARAQNGCHFPGLHRHFAGVNVRGGDCDGVKLAEHCRCSDG